MKIIKRSLVSAILAAATLALAACTDDGKISNSSLPNDTSGHDSSKYEIVSDVDDIKSSIEDFISDLTSDNAGSVG